MAHRDDRVVEGGVGLPWQDDQAFGGQLPKGDHRVDRARMGRGDHHHGALLAEGRRAQTVRGRRQGGDDGVEPPRADVLDQSQRWPRREIDLDQWCRHGEVAQGARHGRGQRIGQIADAQPRGGAVAGIARRLLRHLRVAQHVARLCEERGSGRRERDAALAPVEEGDAELLLELADLLAYRRLSDVQTLRSLAEVQLLRDGDEVPQMPELHRRPPSELAGSRT